MENTVETGLNRTGLDMAPGSKDEMVRFARDAATQEPAAAAGAQALAGLRRDYAMEADRIGSVPVPMRLRGLATAAADTLKGRHGAVLVDKLGERLAYERTGVRLYEAMEVKVRAARGGALVEVEALARMRDDEESHFHLASRCLVSLGADPTAMTPCADTAGVAGSGLLQVVCDPRTTVAQALNALLLVELGDGAGWELLVELAQEGGHPDMAQAFTVALDTEQRHLAQVRGWLRQSVLEEAR